MTNGFVAMNASQVMGIGLLSVAFVYLATAATTWWLSRCPPPSMRYGRVLDPRPSGVRRELRESAAAISASHRLLHKRSLRRVHETQHRCAHWSELPRPFDPRRRTRSLREATPAIPPGFVDAD